MFVDRYHHTPGSQSESNHKPLAGSGPMISIYSIATLPSRGPSETFSEPVGRRAAARVRAVRMLLPGTSRRSEDVHPLAVPNGTSSTWWFSSFGVDVLTHQSVGGCDQASRAHSTGPPRPTLAPRNAARGISKRGPQRSARRSGGDRRANQGWVHLRKQTPRNPSTNCRVYGYCHGPGRS